MSNFFIISDTHFGHAACWEKFKRPDGMPLRPFFSTQEMDETMVKRWNEKVKPDDKVYHLGDIVINKKQLPTLARLNGRKTLIMGNHDIFNSKEYLKYFENIRGVRVFDDMILSHVPLAKQSLSKRFPVNVHGHLHANWICDPQYLCVSVEHLAYAPLAIEEVRQRIRQKRDILSVFTTDGLYRFGNTGTQDGVVYNPVDITTFGSDTAEAN